MYVIYLHFNFYTYKISNSISKYIRLLSVIGNISKDVFSSLVNALSYDVIIFFAEKAQVSPSKHFRMQAFEDGSNCVREINY